MVGLTGNSMCLGLLATLASKQTEHRMEKVTINNHKLNIYVNIHFQEKLCKTPKCHVIENTLATQKINLHSLKLVRKLCLKITSQKIPT